MPGVKPALIFLTTLTFFGGDASAQWEDRSAGLPGGIVYAMEFDPAAATTMLVGTDDGIYRSSDAGLSWLQVGAPGEIITSLSFDPDNSNCVLASGNSGAYVSLDGGLTFVSTLPANGPLGRVEYMPDQNAQSSIAIAALGSSVPESTFFRSFDCGQTWLATQVEAVDLNAILADRSQNGRAWAVGLGGLFETTDFGLTWTAAGFVGVDLYSIAQAPSDPQVIHVSTINGVSTSVAGGQTFSLSFASANLVLSIGVSESNPNDVYIATTAGAFFFRNQQLVDLMLPAVPTGTRECLRTDPDIPGVVWVATSTGLWRYAPEFLRGDANADGTTDVADAVNSLAVLFMGQPVTCELALDVNDDEQLNIADPVSLLGFLFSGGPAPALPFGACGVDLTPGGLGCESFAACP